MIVGLLHRLSGKLPRVVHRISVMMNPQVVFVLGGPGAGKGTQCARIVEVREMQRVTPLLAEKNYYLSVVYKATRLYGACSVFICVQVCCTLHGVVISACPYKENIRTFKDKLVLVRKYCIFLMSFQKENVIFQCHLVPFTVLLQFI